MVLLGITLPVYKVFTLKLHTFRTQTLALVTLISLKLGHKINMDGVHSVIH